MKSLAKSAWRGLSSSNPYTRGHMIGLIVGNVALAAIGTKGLGVTTRVARVGVAARATEASGLSPVVIGQGMPRVLAAANDLAAEVYTGAPRAVGLLRRFVRDPIYAWHNARWLNGAMDAGRLIIDIGPDGRTTQSAWNMEQALIGQRACGDRARVSRSDAIQSDQPSAIFSGVSTKRFLHVSLDFECRPVRIDEVRAKGAVLGTCIR